MERLINASIDELFYDNVDKDPLTFDDLRQEAKEEVDEDYDESLSQYIHWHNRFDRNDDLLNVKTEDEFWETMIKPRFIANLNANNWMMACYESAKNDAIEDLKEMYNNMYAHHQ